METGEALAGGVESLRYLLGIIACVVMQLPSLASAQAMNNDAVVALVKAGLGEGLIIDKINSMACGYDVSTDKLIALKQSGVSEAILSSLVRRCATVNQQRGVIGDDVSNDPKVKHSPGIYVVQGEGTASKLKVLRPSRSSGVRSTGNGSIMFPLKQKMVLTGPSSGAVVPADSPQFYFYFNILDSNVSDFGLENSLAAQSPDEFSLVTLIEKNGGRELQVGKASFYGGSVVSVRNGIDPKYTIPFNVEDVSPGIFKVTVGHILSAGQYAFVFKGGNGAARIYDFSVSEVASSTAAKSGQNVATH